MNERIKELREQLGLSQEEFGVKIGLAKSSVSNIEKGTRAVSERHVKLLCSEYGASEVWLREGKGSMFAQTDDEAYLVRIAKNNSLDPLIMGIVKTYVELTPENKKILTDFVLTVANNVQDAENSESKQSLYDKLKSQIPKDDEDRKENGETSAC